MKYEAGPELFCQELPKAFVKLDAKRNRKAFFSDKNIAFKAQHKSKHVD